MNRAVKTQLVEIYRQFCHVEGNEHIASEFAILKMQEIIRNSEAKKILEVGLGIGSISGSLLKINPDLRYYGTESNQFCLNALKKNLGAQYQRLRLFKNVTELPEEIKFDLIIIDAHDENLIGLTSKLSPSGIIIIEGDRKFQNKILINQLPHSLFVHCISLKKNREYSPFGKYNWQGGVKIIFSNPTRKQYRIWFMEKLKTKLKYQYPGRYFGKKQNAVCI